MIAGDVPLAALAYVQYSARTRPNGEDLGARAARAGERFLGDYCVCRRRRRQRSTRLVSEDLLVSADVWDGARASRLLKYELLCITINVFDWCRVREILRATGDQARRWVAHHRRVECVEVGKLLLLLGARRQLVLVLSPPANPCLGKGA